MEINSSQNPVGLFQEWLKNAARTELNDPDAAALATVGRDGQPSVRMVLLRGADQKGFYFYTNMESRKSRELAENPKAALCVHWKSQQRQVRVEGIAETIPAPVVDAYFKTRHYLSRLSAWASRQSQPLESRRALEERVKDYERKFAGQEIPRPPHWSGFRLVADRIEFWTNQEFRLHDRIVYHRGRDGWRTERLYP